MVHVDTIERTYGRLKLSHMIADSTEELLSMAEKIGMEKRWLQKPGTPHEHFDVCKSKRLRAVALGAIVLSRRELGLKLRERQDVRSRGLD